MELTIPHYLLPFEQKEREHFLHEYFPGRIIKEIIELDSIVKVKLSWPDKKEYLVDPLVEQGLTWWGNCNVVEIPFQVSQKESFCLTLNDNWTLFSWSKWYANQISQGFQPTEVVILHIDDHTDCMAPLVVQTEKGQNLNAFSSTPISLSDPTSIHEAIVTGAIGIGSFMPMFLHHFDRIEFRHLLPSYRLYQSRFAAAGGMHPTLVKDYLLQPGMNRPAVAPGPDPKNRIVYSPCDELDRFLLNIPTGVPVLLHIDMDYFNNRYDGDSDWESHQHIHNPPLESVLNQIHQVISRIKMSVPQHLLADITIALSPGFYPAEYWQPSVELLNSLLKRENAYSI